jgi:hypothetical protein
MLPVWVSKGSKEEAVLIPLQEKQILSPEIGKRMLPCTGGGFQKVWR